jgi:predicted nucleic acid-binding protein
VLYFDSSALIKHYVQEKGSEKVGKNLRVEEQASRPVFTSVLTFVEIHAALARRARDRSLSSDQFIRARTAFDSDWVSGLSAVDIGPGVLSIVRNTVDQFALRGADMVHLASAVWLRDVGVVTRKGNQLVFLTSDKLLAKAATAYGLEVFNPEEAQ